MSIKIYAPQECFDHAVLSRFYHEKPERLNALGEVFNGLGLGITDSPLATTELIELAHTRDYVTAIKNKSDFRKKYGALAATVANALDTRIQWRLSVSPGTYNAALYAAGAVCQAVEDTLSGKTDRAFCAVRPPGHHAEPSRGAGFCVFNNAAIGAFHALNNGAERVAIVDIDRHHGNGTEAIIRQSANPNIMLASSYQEGCKYAKGIGKSCDNLVFVPLDQRSDFSVVQEQYERKIVPKLEAFDPDIILVSAGFDMHIDDPLTNLRVKTEDFHALTKILVDVADRHCNGNFVSVLEGGYELEALAECAEQHLLAMEPDISG